MFKRIYNIGGLYNRELMYEEDINGKEFNVNGIELVCYGVYNGSALFKSFSYSSKDIIYPVKTDRLSEEENIQEYILKNNILKESVLSITRNLHYGEIIELEISYIDFPLKSKKPVQEELDI
mgnify:CR=1 FL=1